MKAISEKRLFLILVGVIGMVALSIAWEWARCELWRHKAYTFEDLPTMLHCAAKDSKCPCGGGR